MTSRSFPLHTVAVLVAVVAITVAAVAASAALAWVRAVVWPVVAGG